MKILIVDDEETIRDLFSQLAQIQGWEVDAVSTGEEALVQVMRKNYDLITLDLNMPGLSGLEVIGMLRNMCPHGIVVIVSGFIPQQIDDGIGDCVDVILSKPVSVLTFQKLLEGAEKISEDMEQIHQLGYVPEGVR
jgi:two-component system response regulator